MTVEDRHRVLYVIVVNTLYGIFVYSSLFHKNLEKDLENSGFIVNPYDICLVNCRVNRKQHTVVQHVDNIKSSHVKLRVNNQFIQWLTKNLQIIQMKNQYTRDILTLG